MSSDTVKDRLNQLDWQIKGRLDDIQQQDNPDPRKLALAKTNFEQAMLWLKDAVRKEQ